jgi:hypothetical protein
MTRVTIGLAQPGDDAALRALLANNPMQGSIELAFLREPSYFAASAVQAPFHQIVVARDGGNVIGVGFRGVRPTFINGEVRDVGYLADLRLDQRYRGGSLVARGYRFFHTLHADGRAKLYLTVIADGNEAALHTIAGNRADLPRYAPIGRIYSPAVRLRGWRRVKANVEVKRILCGAPPPSRARAAEGCGATRSFVLHQLSRKQFAPAQLLVDDFYVAFDGDRIVGALAAWDQSAFKQTRVVRYRGVMRLLRHLAQYPPAGETLRSFYISYVAVDNDDVFRALVDAAVEDHRGFHYFYAGAHERDPLLPTLQNLPAAPFWARAFAVHFEDGAEELARLDGRVPYVELATL